MPGGAIRIESPVSGGRLDGGGFALIGQVEPLAEAMDASYRVNEGPWLPLPRDSQGRFNVSVPMPSQDGTPLPLTVRAVSQAQEYATQVTPLVDNVPPSVSFSAIEQGRGQPDRLDLTFSETVTAPEGGWLTVTAGYDGGTWSSDGKRFRAVELTPNRLTTVAVRGDLVKDLAQNPMASNPSTSFFVEPKLLVKGSHFSPGGNSGVVQMAAKSDADGVLSFATVIRPDVDRQETTGYQLDPETGAVVSLGGSEETTGTWLQAMAVSVPDLLAPPSNTRRVWGFHHRAGDVTTSDNGVMQWKEASGAVSSFTGALAGIVGTPLACGEPGTEAIGRLRVQGGTTWYRRNAISERALGLRTQLVEVRDGNNWQLLGQNGTHLDRLVLSADCVQSPEFALASSFRSDLKADDAQVSVAWTAGGRFLLVFDSSSGERREACYPCVLTAAGAPCSPESVRAASSSLRVASRRVGNRVIGVRRFALNFEILERDLSDCGSDWTVLYGAGGAATQVEAVMIGSHPGIVALIDGQVRFDWYETP